MAILRGRLKGSMPGKDPIDITFFASDQFLDFLGVPISGRLDEFFRQIPRYVRLKELFQ